MKDSSPINGYELVSEVLRNYPDDAVEKLLSLSGNDESYWLEFKAGMRLLPEDESRGENPKDLYWKVAVAVISIMNTCGGAVFIGIDDKKHNAIDLRANDPLHVIEKSGLEAYRRQEIYDRINPQNGIWETSHGRWELIERLPDNIEVKGLKYQEKDIAVILIKPCKTECVRIMLKKGGIISEQLPKRVKGQIGEIEYIVGSKKMDEYERNREICPEEFMHILQSLEDKRKGQIAIDKQILEQMQQSIQANASEIQLLKHKQKNTPDIPLPKSLQKFNPQTQKASCISDVLSFFYISSFDESMSMDLLDISNNYEYFANLISAYLFSIYIPNDYERFYQILKPTFGTCYYRFNYALRIDTKKVFSPSKTEKYYTAISVLLKEISCVRFDTGRDFNDISSPNFIVSLKSLLSFVLYIRNQYLHERIRVLNYFTQRLSQVYVEIIDLFQELKISESLFIVMQDNNILCLNAINANSRFYKDIYSKTRALPLPKAKSVIHRQQVGSKKSKTNRLAGIEFVFFDGGAITYTPSGWKHPSEDFVKPFAISKYPITNQQFLAFLQKNPDYYKKSLSNPLFLKDYRKLDVSNQNKVLDAAVYYIGWNDAVAYCNYMNALIGRPNAYTSKMFTLNNNGFRLPSEAEWCFALTGGNTSFSTKKDEKLICRDNRGLFGKVASNTSLSENEFGVCGMLGNINEWTNTDATVIRLKSFEKDRDNSKIRKIIKGGSFASAPWMITPDYATDVPIDNLHYIGFRIAFSVE